VDGNDTYFSQEISIVNIDVKLRASNRALKRAMNVKGFNQLLNLIALRTLSSHVYLVLLKEGTSSVDLLCKMHLTYSALVARVM